MTSSIIAPAEGESEEREGGRPRLGDLRSHLTCVLCAGYFIDATTIVECLHTFCRSCILRHLEASAFCPICEVKIHRTKGSSSLRADRILQTLVYKMVPDLFRQEMQQRRDFYEEKPYADPELPQWAKGDVTSYVPHVFTPDEHLHLRLAMFGADRCKEDSPEEPGTAGGEGAVPAVRYLRCQAGTPLSVLHKFIHTKFQLPATAQVRLISGRHVLPDDVTLMDLGYMGYLAQEGHTCLSFQLVQKRKRLALETEPSETPPVKSARLEASPPESVGVGPARLDASLPESVPVIPAKPDAPFPKMPAGSSTCCSSPNPETPTTTATPTTGRPPSVTEGSSPVLATRASPSTFTKPAQPDVAPLRVADSKSPVLAADAPKLPSLPAPAISSACSNPSPVLFVTVPTETMFDPDDEEPTSPQIVQDIIASLDAEDEDQSVGDAVAVAGQITNGDAGSTGALKAVEEVDRRKPDEGAHKPVLCSTSKEDAVRASNARADVVNGGTTEESRETGKVVCEHASVSHSVDSKKHELRDRQRARTGENFSRASVDNASPKLNLASTTSLRTSESSQDSRTKVVMHKPTIGSSKSNGMAAHIQSKGTAASKSCGQDTNVVQSRPDDGDARAGTSNGVVDEVTKHANSADTGRCDTPGTSEALIEKRCNPDAFLPVTKPSGNERAHVPSTESSSSAPDCSRQTSLLLQKVGQVPKSKHGPCYTPSLGAKEMSKTATAVQDSLLGYSLKASEASGKHAGVKVTHVSKEMEAGSPDVYKLSAPSPASKTAATSCRTALKTPKSQCIMHDVMRTTNAQLSKQNYLPVLAATKPKSHPFTMHNAGFQQNTAAKRCHDEPVAPAKRAKNHHDGPQLITPLDLSNPSKKTVAADSTSTPSRSPTPSPKPKLPKLKTGKSQTIHSIVDNLANREHISLTALPSKPVTQMKKPSNHLKDLKLTEIPRKPPTPHVSSTNIPRKAPQNVKTTAGVPRKPSHYTQPQVTVSSPMSPHRPLPMSLPTPESASCYLPPSGLCSPPLHVDTSLASRLSYYDMAMRNLLTLSHMSMAQGGMIRPPHMFPMQPMFPPRPKSHDFHPVPDPSLLRQQSEARMGAVSKKASPTAGTTAPQLRTPTALTSASIQHMEDLTRTVGKKAGKERHSVTVTPIPFKG